MKTKKSFRKKALLSSVAMLLVAAVAVGSATFAWFTQSTHAFANGIYLKTMRGSSLQVSNKSFSWGPSFSYDIGNEDNPHLMYPASSADGKSWFHAHATSEDNYAPNANGIKAIDTNKLSTYVFKDMLNVKNSGDTGAGTYNNVKITLENPTIVKEYTRIALVEVQSQSAPDTFKGTFGNDTIFAANNKEYTAISSTTLSECNTKITPTKIVDKSTVLANVGTLAPGEAKYYMLLIWFEGQDEDCKDTTIPMDELAGLQFNVDGTFAGAAG